VGWEQGKDFEVRKDGAFVAIDGKRGNRCRRRINQMHHRPLLIPIVLKLRLLQNRRSTSIGAIKALVRGLGFDMGQLPKREDREQWPVLREIFTKRFKEKTRAKAPTAKYRPASLVSYVS
jgi:hypothetical protein